MTGEDLALGILLKQNIDAYALAIADITAATGDAKFVKAIALVSAGNSNITTDEHADFLIDTRADVADNILTSITARKIALETEFEELGETL